MLNSALLRENREYTKVTSLTQMFRSLSTLIIAQIYFTQSQLLCCGKISELVLSKNSSNADLGSHPLVQYKSLMIHEGMSLLVCVE